MEYYYHDDLSKDHFTLSSEESKHCTTVMHNRAGDNIVIIDGKGTRAEGTILSIDRSGCHIAILTRRVEKRERNIYLHIAIAPTKKRERIEFFLEKAIEIGIEKVTFLICARSEREKIDLQRLERVAIAAVKQSHTLFLPEIEIEKIEDFLHNNGNCEANKWIAWCDAASDATQLATAPITSEKVIIMIGPEGDFIQREIDLAKRDGFNELLLGDHRLRTETAGIYACCAIEVKNRQII